MKKKIKIKQIKKKNNEIKKEDDNKNVINIKKKNKADKEDEAEKKNKIKNYDTKQKKDKIKKEFSKSIDIKKPNKLINNKYNLNINFEQKKFQKSLEKKKSNILNKKEKKDFLKSLYIQKNLLFNIDNQKIDVEENIKIFNSFEIKKKDLYIKKELNNNLKYCSNISKSEINKSINSICSSTKNNNIEDVSSSSNNEFKKISISGFSSKNNIKDNSNTSTNKFEINPQINSSDFPSKNNTTSFYYNLPFSESNTSLNIKEKEIEENKEKKDKEIDNYKFKFFKNKLNLEEEDNLSGNAYEEYAKKIIKLMFILSIKKMPIFNNPQKIEVDFLIYFYLKQFKLGTIKMIDTPIKKLLFDKTKKNKHFEIDIVFELNKIEIINFIDKFKSKIYFKDNYLKIEKDKDNEEKITCFMEIARNLISQGKEKLEQIKKYIKIIKIMNNMRNLIITDINEYERILSKYKCSKETEKVFSIITDGNYDELNFVLNKIVIPQLNYLEGKELKDNDIKKIKENIRNIINDKKELFGNIINKDSLFDNIYYVFEILYHLKINKLKFCLIYIGEICEITCNLTNILNRLKELKYLNESENDLNKYADKKRKYLLNLKSIYHDIKSIIQEFGKKCDKNIRFSKESIDKILDEIDYNIFDFDNFISKHKFQCNAFIFFKEDESSKNSYENIFLFQIKSKEDKILFEPEDLIKQLNIKNNLKI